MPFRIYKDAEPQFKLLLLATLVSVAIWVTSLFLPALAYVLYPLRLFATFIHEGGHAVAALITGSEVASLAISPDASGEVYSISESKLASLFISSAGYLSTTALGAALLVWMRLGLSARKALYFLGGFVTFLTVFFGFLAPVWHFLNTVTAGGFFFTIFSGLAIGAVLIGLGRLARPGWANFAIAFITIQLLLHAVYDLMNVFFITTSTNLHSDAANMTASTGIPGFVWVLLWMFISFLMISLGLRIYAFQKKKSAESLFNE
ncbi:MAG: hypothetical protein C4324_08690 [Blastocatellia bacterium]